MEGDGEENPPCEMVSRLLLFLFTSMSNIMADFHVGEICGDRLEANMWKV